MKDIMFEMKPCNSCPMLTCVELSNEICPFDKAAIDIIDKMKQEVNER